MKENISSDLIEIGLLIRKNREFAKMTQSDLAEKAGIYDKSVSRLETGTSKMRLDTFFGLAEALGVSPNEISPQRLVPSTSGRFAEIERRYVQLSESEQALFLRMVSAMLDGLLQKSR